MTCEADGSRGGNGRIGRAAGVQTKGGGRHPARRPRARRDGGAGRRLPRPPVPPSTRSTLYRQAVATTQSWSVHYNSTSMQSKQTLVVAGDAGPASGSQTVSMGTGTITILVIGGTTYIKGNAGGLQSLAGLSASQAADAAGQWIEFSTSNGAFAQVVAGVRSHDVATQLLLKGPLSRAPAGARRVCRRCHRWDADLRAQGGPRRPVRARPGDPPPGGGGLVDAKGSPPPPNT